MRLLLSLALASTCISCGFTIGVDAREESFEAEHSAAGITKLRASDLAVRKSVIATGGADSIRASLATTRWFNDGSPATDLQLSLEESGPELSLAVWGASESTTVTSVDLRLASGVALAVEVVSGAFEARDIDGEIYVKSASLVDLKNCTGAIQVDAPNATIVGVDPMNVEASGAVNASLSAGGFITAKQLTVHLDAVQGDLLASTQIAGGGSISLFVPNNTPLTLVIRAKTQVFIELDDYAFDSNDPDRPDDGLDIVSGIMVDIAGGGPQIDLAAETAVFVYGAD